MRATLSYNFSSTWQRVAVTEFKRGEGILWKYIYSFQIKVTNLLPFFFGGGGGVVILTIERLAFLFFILFGSSKILYKYKYLLSNYSSW